MKRNKNLKDIKWKWDGKKKKDLRENCKRRPAKEVSNITSLENKNAVKQNL